jgi:hypothetical protein
MLTFFTTAKPFKGHTAIIQQNALQSWKKLHPEVEVLVFGDDEGSAEVCAELRLRHEPNVARTKSGAIHLDDMFSKAQVLAKHDVLCYVNCDIILMQDFCEAVARVRTERTEFLMVGRRWDVDIRAALPFEDSAWQADLLSLVSRQGKKRGPDWIDYFAFSRGLYGAGMPPFAVGRTCWDNWLVRKALDMKKVVIDVTGVVVAVHQNHDYSHHPEGKRGTWHGDDARRNVQLAGGYSGLRTISDAPLLMARNGLRRNPRRYWMFVKRPAGTTGRVLLYRVWHPIWFAFLGVTRPLRTAMGLRKP